jgi:hypothetical protein
MATVDSPDIRSDSAPSGKSLLGQILDADDIQPGDPPSYEICKLIWIAHPLGGKMVDAPVKQAMTQSREITVSKGGGTAEERVVEAFTDEWDRLGCDDLVSATCSTARAYGIASLAYGAKGRATNVVIDPWKLPGLDLYFNVLDPLNTSGSLVLNQDPNSPDFQKPAGTITAAGQPYHRSRTVVLMHERPVYLAYSNSAFGYVGRSVFQRVVYPLKSFLQTMVTDDMVSRKAGLLVVKMKAPGSIIDQMMNAFGAIKRALLQAGRTNNVLSVGQDDEVETLNMQNLDKAASMARTNILKNIATGADMPAVMLENETLTEGFGEGTEDAKIIAAYVDGVRKWMRPVYTFLDPLVMHRAWTEEFYAALQAEFPENYGSVPYKTAFMQWKNTFRATWPSLLKEPPSEEVRVQEIVLKAIVSVIGLATSLPPAVRAEIWQWAEDNINELKMMFPKQMLLSIDEIEDYEPVQVEAEAGAENTPGGLKSLKMAS